jgi:hypothetical protein
LRGPYKTYLEKAGKPYDFVAFKAKVVEKVLFDYLDQESKVHRRREGRAPV